MNWLSNPWDRYTNITERPDEIREILTMESTRIPSRLWSDCGFQNFRVNDGNRAAWNYLREMCCLNEQCREMTEEESRTWELRMVDAPPKRLDNPSFILLHGDTGVGKTHLAVAYAKLHASNLFKQKVLFWHSQRLLDWLRDGFSNHQYGERMKRVEEADLLVLDDFGAQKDTEWAIPTLESIIDLFYSTSDKELVVTTNSPPSKFDKRISSRLRSGYVFNIKDVDHRIPKKESEE